MKRMDGFSSAVGSAPVSCGSDVDVNMIRNMVGFLRTDFDRLSGDISDYIDNIIQDSDADSGVVSRLDIMRFNMRLCSEYYDDIILALDECRYEDVMPVFESINIFMDRIRADSQYVRSAAGVC